MFGFGSDYIAQPSFIKKKLLGQHNTCKHLKIKVEAKRKLGILVPWVGLHKLKPYSSSFCKGALCGSQFPLWLLQTAMRVRHYHVAVAETKTLKSGVNLPNKLLIPIP
ncbi:hypothetical protein V8G54_013925 [Vigna mungo]|uniref:Uncharacterized protein n=1 Tax=Vigna mungo TaxID=3915 RepID=A0AAQ3NGQ3_VIGMU